MPEAKRILRRLAVEPILIEDLKEIAYFAFHSESNVDRSTRSIVNTIKFEYKTGGVDEVLRLLGSLNLSDPGTKTNSPLNQPLQIMMINSTKYIDWSRSASRGPNLGLDILDQNRLSG